MKRKLNEIADITQGSILTRIKSQCGMNISVFTMQELSYYVNLSDDKGEVSSLTIDKMKYENICLSKKNDVLIGLSSGKSMVVEKNDTGKLIISNFARVRIHDSSIIDPYYLCWLINENKDIQKEIKSLTQGTSRVSILPLTFLKEIKILLLPIEQQKKIGAIYNLKRKQIRIRRTKAYLSNLIQNQFLLEIYRR